MENINDIISSLTDDDINMLKGVASSILGGNKDGAADNGAKSVSSAQSNRNQGSTQNTLPADLGFENIDFDMVMRAKKIFDKMNNTPSKNADLIIALKPHLSPETQNKADQALRILKLFEVLPLLRELF